MRRLIIILILTNLSPGNALFAQENSFHYYDSLTFALYESGDFNGVLTSGKEALKSGFDYYYLRMRMGISCYELHRYGAATSHFKHALRMNYNATVLEYLYYSYLNSGQAEQARLLLCQHKDMLSYLDVDCSRVVSGLYLEGGVKYSNEVVREIGDISFFHAGISHNIGSRLDLYHGYSHIIQQFYNYEWVDSSTGGSGNGNGPGGPSNPDDSVEVASEYRVIQNEYFASLTFNPGKGLLIIPAYHFQAVSGMDDNYAFSVRVVKTIQPLSLRISYGKSHINLQDQAQYSAGITCYPLNNQDLYFLGDYTLHRQQENSSFYYSKLGVRVLHSAWIEGFYGWGDMYNFTDFNGFYVYNLPDVITSRMGGALMIALKQRHALNIGYVLENKESVLTGLNYRHSGFYLSLNFLL